MRKSLRIISLLLCLVLLSGLVFATEPTALPEPETETAAGLPDSGTSPAAEEEGGEPVYALTETGASANEATEPVTEATEPVTEPTEPVTEATEPVTEPTEPVTEPTEPVTEPTEPPAPPEPQPPIPPEPKVKVPKAGASATLNLTDKKIIAQYSIEDNWARKALVYAVRNRILAGRTDTDLAPLANTTHAEMAAILMRILNTKKAASLSRFTDVPKSAWYYKTMQKAVSLGIWPIANAGATKLTPNQAITREEAFVAIARAFGVHSTDKQGIYKFSDWRNVSAWAVNDLAAMADLGFISGADNNKLLPKSKISRRELAQVLYRILTRVDTGITVSSFKGRYALGSWYVPPKTKFTGDLILSTDETSVVLKKVSISGKLTLQGNGALKIWLTDCSVNSVVACRPTTLYSAKGVKTVTANKALVCCGNVDTVNAYGDLTIPAGCSVGTVNVMAGSKITVNGKVGSMNVLGSKAVVSGSGSIDTMTVRGTGLKNSCATGKVVNNPYKTAKDVKAVRTDKYTAANIANPTVSLSLRLSNMPDGQSDCTLYWYANNKLMSNTKQNLLKEGSVISKDLDLTQFLDGSTKSVSIKVAIEINGVKATVYSGTLGVSGSLKDAAANIRTQNVQGTVRAQGTLFSSYSMTTPLCTVPANTQVTILMSSNSTATKLRLQDGTVGWMNYYNVAVSNEKFYTTADYSTALKEYYVNNVRKCTSKTGWLIWVSLYTQRVNIFKGSKGNWKLYNSGPISSGRNECPTPVEVASLLYHTRWNYENYYCYKVTVFDDARGFHSRPTGWDGSVYYAAMGYPASHGCVRLLDAQLDIIHDQCPLGTAVYIY